MMDQHALRVLEFDKIREMLRHLTSSSLGREAVEELHPMTYPQAIRDALDEVTEMTRLYQARQEPPLNGLYDVAEPLKRSRIGGAVLDPAEILVIGETVTAARRIQEAMRRVTVDVPRMRVYAGRLIPHPEIEQALDRVFDEQKNIRDGASPALSRVRKTIRQHRADLTRKLERLMRSAFKEYLAEPYYTQREERYVLPVDARYQSKVPGIIHDRSATGATVFIEPLSIIDDGNRLLDLHREEQMEIRRILRELTALIAEHSFDLEQNLELFRHLDFVSAKARLSEKLGLHPPVILDDGVMMLIEARHPLLLARAGRDGVVPLDLKLPEGVRGVVVTGPNTGGKTVVLKTIGLIAMMAQSGLHVSAAPGTELPVFQSIGADIGDEQSLEQSLSTFSSHMANIRRVLEMANERSLVLLDELGSGTDPEEGGALACSIIEQVYQQGAFCVVTTHLQDVKVFAHQTEGLRNGAMEFDMQRLQPTFRFMLGLPGRSNAIEIADRLGLPPLVIERARLAQAARGESPEELLARLSEEVQHARERTELAELERARAEALRQESETRMEGAKREARHVVEKSERKAQNLLQELERRLKDLEKLERDFQKQWKDKLDSLLKESEQTAPPESTLQNLRKSIAQARSQVSSKKMVEPAPRYTRKPWRWEQLAPGVRVRLAGLTEMAKVIRADAGRKLVEVSVNSMTLRVKSDQILSVHGVIPEPAPEYSTTVRVERPDQISNSIDIHGMTVEEMIPVVQQYIDRAFRGGLSTAFIVHGHGTGTLRREVRRLLTGHPVVRNFKNGDPFEGGQGVTVVNLNTRM
ncbi:MAG: endonuclease MutS2 [bacterium]|nr:endonuclease MutS2 [bacterium]